MTPGIRGLMPGVMSLVSTVVVLSPTVSQSEPSLTIRTPVKVCTLQTIAESSVVLMPS
eukprot:COSAG02_NODE_31623_length_530_cov_1.064965_1_plen_57_part_01